MQVKKKELELDMEKEGEDGGGQGGGPGSPMAAKGSPKRGATGLDESQAGIKIVRRNTNNLTYADDTTLMTEREE